VNHRSLTSDNVAAIDRFVSVANRYCSTLDSAKTMSGPELLRALAEQLPGLYRAALDLPDIEPATSDSNDLQLRAAANEDAHRVQESLPSELSDYAVYWQVFDPFEDPLSEPVASDLRSDLVEIYEDVRTGIQSWPTASSDDRADIAWEWRFGFIHHWGRHATSALTAIHWLLFDRFIELSKEPAE
jgi:hypothetical protein